jgi:uncharacterized repeat protein (TIGR04138 family)
VNDDFTNMWERIEASTGVPLDGIRFIYATFNLKRQHASRSPDVEQRPSSHCTAREFCRSFVQFAEETFGKQYFAALNSWGLNSSEKLGRVVFALVDRNLLWKQDGDLLSDFDGHFDFSDINPEVVTSRIYCYPRTELRPGPRRRRPSIGKKITAYLAILVIFYGVVVFASAIEDYVKPIPVNLIILLMVIALAMLPAWMAGPRRFSVRTLLMIMTTLAVVLGLIVWAVRT